MVRKYTPKRTKEQLEEAIRNSPTIRDALLYIGLNVGANNYITFKKECNYYSLDITKYKRVWNKGKPYIPLRPINEYLQNRVGIKSHRLRCRLISEGIKKNQCEKCKGLIWNDLPIPLELHHINGNRLDNRLENLRILCPNCHKQES